MEEREIYLRKLIENNGRLNEIDLGESIGLNEDETQEIIATLLSEHKIEYAENRACNYRLLESLKRKLILKF